MSQRKSNGFTLVELLVVIGIIAVLIAMLLPALNRAKQGAQSVKCMSNLRQFGIVSALYTTETGGYCFPYKYDSLSGVATGTSYRVLMAKYLPAPTSGTVHKRGGYVYNCPSSRFDVGSATMLMLGYGLNKSVHVQYQYDGVTKLPRFKLTKLARIPRPNEVISMSDCNQPSNVSFDVDGHLDYTESTVSQLSLANKNANAERLTFDVLPWWNRDSEGMVGFVPRYRHNGSRKNANYLWLDGHVSQQQIKDLKIKNITINY